MGIPPELQLSERRPQVVDDFTESVPPSPSTRLLDQLPAPHVGNGKDDLSYISRMLFEDTIDSLLCQYPNHPAALVTAEQPLAPILSTAHGTSSDGLTTMPCNSVQNTPLQLPSAMATPEYYSYCNMIASEVPPGDNMDSTYAGQDASSSLLMNSMHETAAVEPNRLLPAAKSSSCCMDVISMAFFKGMEEANKLLPLKDSETTLARDRGWKKRLQAGKDVDANVVTMGRSSKQKVAQKQPADSEDEATAREMLGRLMLNDASHAADVEQELLIGSMELEKPQGRRGAGASLMVVDLHALLIRCAETVATNDQQGAVDLLQRIRHHSSPIGDGTQRLAHCFAQGLEARLMGTGSQMYQSLVAKSASAASTLKAYKLYMAACSILPLRFPLTNKTTYKAVAGRKKLHVVHYGLGPGFHWPNLLRMLSHREGGPPEVRLTGIDNPLPGLHPGQLIEDTGRRLSDCARQFRVPFKFHAIAAKSDAVRAEDLDIDPEEVVVVISHLHFRTLMDESVIIDRPNPRDMVLKNIKKMRPKVFIHGILNGSYSGAFFVSRFREALNNFAAMFDLMATILPQESQNRLLVEEALARCAMNIIACEGVDRVERPHNYKQWQVRCERAGLRQLPLDPDIVRASKDKVSKEYRKYNVVNEDHGWLLMGWKGRVLVAISTWTAEDNRSDLGNDQ